MSWMNWIPTRTFGFVGERKALAATATALFSVLFAILALLFAVNPDAPYKEEFTRCFGALAVCYGVAFFALVADWFWARWVVVGLGYSGVTMALWLMVQTRYADPLFLWFGGLHAVMILMLQGERMIQHYDGQPAWRKRFQVDDETAYRIGKTVTRTMSSVPSMILFVLGPRDEALSFGSLHMSVFGWLKIDVSVLNRLHMNLSTFGWLGVGIVSMGVLATAYEQFLRKPVVRSSLC